MAPSGRGRTTRSTRRSRTIAYCRKVQRNEPNNEAEASASLNHETEASALIDLEAEAEALVNHEDEASASVNHEAEASASFNHEIAASASVESSDNLSRIDGVKFETNICCGCSTPKAKKFRIPEILTCPPAPKKRRPSTSNCSLRRNPISFFAPPDLELFFFAVRDIPV
ncbi:hypothetical protein LguiA_013316 [Lonicera macranthoides]